MHIPLDTSLSRPKALYKVIGEYDPGKECECGIWLEADFGILAIVSGAFPCSINVICSLFDQKLTFNSFQRFKYYMKPVKLYA